LENDEILTVKDVAVNLRCSKAHVYKAIAGTVAGVSPLPAIPMGRRFLVRRNALECWKRSNEQGGFNDIVPSSPEVDAARRMKGNAHAQAVPEAKN
jgi:excisionase family DNA binding protein